MTSDNVQWLADRACGADAVHALLVLGHVSDPVKRENYLRDVLRHSYMQGMLAGLEASNRTRPAPAPVEHWHNLVEPRQ